MKNKYSNQQKEEIIKEFKQSGMSAISFSKKYGAFGTSLLRWKKSYGKLDIEVPVATVSETNFVEFKISRKGIKKEYS